MSSYTEYFCEITGKKFSQKSHIDKHLKSTFFKQESKIKELEFEKLSKKELKKKYGTSKIDKIIKKLSCIKKEQIELSNSDSENELDTVDMPNVNQSYSNKDTLRDMVHSIHNFLRNNGVGYGMSALKIFNLFYGLKKIEDNGHFEKTDLPNYCKFSEIKKKFISNNQQGLNDLLFTVLPGLYQEKKIKELLFTPITETIPANTIKTLMEMIEKLVTIEESNFQLTGKIYEYFIGRDATAISELGAYFTDRHITNYIYEKLLKPTLDDNGNVRTFIDMFGGSGGFTLGYMNYLNDNCKPNWKDNLNKVYHYDMNLDVVKYAKLEYYCLTGEFPDNNIGTRNSFQDEFLENSGNKKYHYICTNPPYGGDKIEKTEQVEIMQMIKKEIEQYFKGKYKIKNMKQVSKLKLTSIEKNKIKQFTEVIKKLKVIDEHFRSQTVMLSNSSNRFQQYAKDNKIDGSKCKNKEAVSFLMIMNMLEEGGTAIGVLKEGIFFDSKYGHLRKHLIENFNVTKVVSIDASQFENTTTKTSIIMFSNTGKTEQIEFYDFLIEKEDKTTVKEKENGTYEMKTFKDRIVNVYDKHLATATYEQIVENEYTLNHKKYNKIVLVPNDGYKMDNFLDKGNYMKKSKLKASYGKEKGNYNFYTSSEKIKLCNEILYKELSLIIGTGGNGSLFIDKNFNCSTDNFIIKFNTDLLTKYKYYILKSNWYILTNSMHGSTIKHITKDMLDRLQLPVPKTEQKMKHWVDKINKPYNRLIKCKEKLKILEEKVQTGIQEILDNNETECIMLSELCEYIKTGKHITNRNGSKYPYYGTSKIICYLDNYLFEGKHISIARKGDCIINFLDNKFTSNDDTILLKCNKINTYILYFILISNKDNLFNYNGSTVKGIKKTEIEKTIITLPKDRKLLDSLNSLFEEIDSLNEEIPKQEQLYNQYIQELRKDAIKDTSNKQINDEPIIISDDTDEELPQKNIKKKNNTKKKILKTMNANII